MKKYSIISALLCLSAFLFLQSSIISSDNKTYFTTGIKIGEVTQSSAIIWTRLCKSEKAVPVHHKRKPKPFRSPLNFSDTIPEQEMEGAVAGISGEVKMTLHSENDTIFFPWTKVSDDKDYTFCKKIDGLSANTEYKILVQGRNNNHSPITEIDGSFRTAPNDSDIAEVSFTSTSCQYYWDHDDSIRGFKTYDSMLKLKPDFHCQTGDFVYYDKPGPIAINIELARHKWNAMNSWPSLVDFYSHVPLFLQKDDHDMLKDDASPKISPLGEFTFKEALKIWREQVPIKGKPYRTFRWGKDLQIWLVEGREYRSENKMVDCKEKSIWGEKQKKWFVETMEASDATFKILMSPTPVVGPDRVKGKNDNHANLAYKTEGDWLRNFLSKQKNAFVINGDRHWQYVSKDLETGLMEFSQGPTSDEHAQGWKPGDLRPEHRFLRVNGGFVYISIFRENGCPYISFYHYDVDGKEVHKETIKASNSF